MSTTLTPFLYQTRTLQRLPATAFLAPVRLRSFSHAPANIQSRRQPRRHRSDEDHEDYSIPFDLPPGIDLTTRESGRVTGAEAEAEAEAEAQSTITPTERKTFDSIFHEIAERRRSTGMSQIANNVINLVVQDAERSSRNSAAGPGTVSDRDAALGKFPPSLRKVARIALGSMEDNDAPVTRQLQADPGAADASPEMLAARSLGEGELLDWDDDGLAIDQLVKTATIGEHRRRERRRIEKWMNLAESDFDLWKSMTKDVFGMVEKLGIGEKSGSQDEAPAPGKTRSFNVYIHGPLYPLMLLRGLRLLDKAFDKPSPLALSILPRIQQLGLASYVLGASTPFYNTLMGIYWYRYGDVSAVFGLMEEMRRAGLSFDTESLGILRDMESTLTPYANGASGQFVQELTAMPEYEAALDSRLSHWERVIQSSIEDKKPEPVY